MLQVRQSYYDAVQKVSGNADLFFQKLSEMCNRLGVTIDDVASVMWIETGKTFDPKIKNPNSSASGLIQFMEATAKGLGTTTTQLRAMSNIEQLTYVEKYFKNQINAFGKPKDFFDVYTLVFYPTWLKMADTAQMTISASKANIGIDTYFGNKDGIVSKGEFRKFAMSKLPINTLIALGTKKKSTHCNCPNCGCAIDLVLSN
ncbi:hypothetical protein [Pseudopedobacter beijingensis]|uniref:Transglycosylase SLT domain-containing protein n=1 Tax=Pseudopedobacter beijingensis TaxID=1207056 RepID=A0ABW4IGW0_9SPHI